MGLKKEVDWLQKECEKFSRVLQKEKNARKQFAILGKREYCHRKVWAAMCWRNASSAIVWENRAREKNRALREATKSIYDEYVPEIAQNLEEALMEFETGADRENFSITETNEISAIQKKQSKKLCACGKLEFDTRNKVKKQRLNKRLAEYTEMDIELKKKYCWQCGRQCVD